MKDENIKINVEVKCDTDLLKEYENFCSKISDAHNEFLNFLRKHIDIKEE